jgi:hypothetical protein
MGEGAKDELVAPPQILGVRILGRAGGIQEMIYGRY